MLAHLWKPTTTQGTLARLVLASCRSATANFCSRGRGTHLAQHTRACTLAHSTARSPSLFWTYAELHCVLHPWRALSRHPDALGGAASHPLRAADAEGLLQQQKTT